MRPIGNGLGVDKYGGPVIDPTANVLALVEAANKRQDDLRTETNQRVDADIQHLREISDLRAEHAKEIREIETNRLNAVRQVDQSNVSTAAADRAAAAVQALAATTAANAENLRNALVSTATTIATQTDQKFAGMAERIAALEKSSYEGKGRQAYSDPAMAELLIEVRNLRESRAGASGKGQGMEKMWGWVVAAIMLAVTLWPHIPK